jgi:hypothetical protein
MRLFKGVSLGHTFAPRDEHFSKIRAAPYLARFSGNIFMEMSIMKQEKRIRAANNTSESISTRLQEDGI